MNLCMEINVMAISVGILRNDITIDTADCAQAIVGCSFVLEF